MDQIRVQAPNTFALLDEPRFHQNWIPICLAQDLVDKAMVGVDVVGTRVVAYRDPQGHAVVQTAWCPHLGADLSQGLIVAGTIQCPYHHWAFDALGKCAHIPTGDKIPPGARIATWPAAECWGLIWAFVGPAPLYPVPCMPDAEEHELVFSAHLRGLREVPPWISVSNGVDFQHLRTVHDLPGAEPDSLMVTEHSIDYRIEAAAAKRHGLITGTNVFAQRLERQGIESFMLFAGAPIDQQRTRSFFVVATRKLGSGPADAALAAGKLKALRESVERLVAEDEPILNSMRFKKGVLVASDRYLSRYFKYVDQFPAAAAPI